MIRRWLPAVLCVAALAAAAPAADEDVLKAVKDRKAVEAQRVEREFTDNRAAAYKLVRSDNPKLSEASEKLHELLALVENDTSLQDRRRRQLIVTLKWDLDKVKEIAAERRRNARLDVAPPAAVRRDVRRDNDEERSRSVDRNARAIIESRGQGARDSGVDRVNKGDRFNRTLAEADKSAVPDPRNYTLPNDWAEKTRKRSAGVAMTAKEKAIMEALRKTLDVDYKNNSLSDVLDNLRKITGIDIAADKRGLDDAGVTYESTVNLTMRSSGRTVIKRVLADLGLAYVIKDEVLQITSAERARQLTTTRSYYIGDLATVVDITVPPVVSQLRTIETVNRILAMIKQNVDPKSSRENNPDAAGQIYFDPASMSLVVKQTAEVHFLLSGK